MGRRREGRSLLERLVVVVMSREMVGVEAGYILIGEYCIVLKTTLLHGVRELDKASGRDTTLLY